MPSIIICGQIPHHFTCRLYNVDSVVYLSDLFSSVCAFERITFEAQLMLVYLQDGFAHFPQIGGYVPCLCLANRAHAMVTANLGLTGIDSVKPRSDNN